MDNSQDSDNFHNAALVEICALSVLIIYVLFTYEMEDRAMRDNVVAPPMF